ncbi:MAG TPA: CvpA family protein [Bryobacteraceae bacterium]
MSLLDILLGLIIISSVMAGFVAGFARVGIGFCATLVGIVFGFWYYQTPAAWIHKYLSSETVSNVFGFLVVLWAVLLVGAMVAKVVAMVFKWTGLSWLNRLLGAVFGFARGALIGVAFVAVLLAFAPKPVPNWMVDSKLLPYAIDASNICASIAPAALKDAFLEGMLEIRKDWEDQLKKAKRKKEDRDFDPADKKEVI